VAALLDGRAGDMERFSGCGVEGRRPKKDKRPVLVVFFLSSDGTGPPLSLSTMRHPAGRTLSSERSNLDFTEASHAVEPLEAMYWAMGLERMKGTCLVRRTASAMDLWVKDLEKGGRGWRARSEGSTLLITDALNLYQREGERGEREREK
jgi:hypothetical protein